MTLISPWGLWPLLLLRLVSGAHSFNFRNIDGAFSSCCTRTPRAFEPQIISHTKLLPVIFLLFAYFLVSPFSAIILSLYAQPGSQPGQPAKVEVGEMNNLEVVESKYECIIYASELVEWNHLQFTGWKQDLLKHWYTDIRTINKNLLNNIWMYWNA